MKARHVSAYRIGALEILKMIGANQSQDFFTLSASQISKLLECADVRHYRRPAGANGSRARYFFQTVQRRANGK